MTLLSHSLRSATRERPANLENNLACGYPSGESRSAATAVASAGVDANADYESAAGSSDEAMNEGQRWKKKLFSEQG
jgi:hypothetical protein